MNFQLFGDIVYATGSCSDDCEVSIDRKFKANTVEAAITKAKKIVAELHEKYKNKTDYSLSAELRIIKITPIWKTNFVKNKLDEVKLDVSAHFKETRIK